MKKAALAVLIVAACGRSRDTDVGAHTAPPAQAAESGAAAVTSEMQKSLAAKELFFAAIALDDAKPEDMKTIATNVVPTILGMWDAVRESELKNARTLGSDRARGKARNNCTWCERFRGALDKLAPHSTELAAKWAALKPELERAEAAAYDAEANDGRPKVFVRTQDDTAVMVLSCAMDQLKATFPAYKFVEDYATSGSDPNAPALEIASKKGTTAYANAKGETKAAVLSGLQITLTGKNLDKQLAKRFRSPITVTHEVSSPSEIRSVVGTPIAEASKVGLSNIGELENQVCADLAKRIATK
jgi:hypothetical protein